MHSPCHACVGGECLHLTNSRYPPPPTLHFKARRTHGSTGHARADAAASNCQLGFFRQRDLDRARGGEPVGVTSQPGRPASKCRAPRHTTPRAHFSTTPTTATPRKQGNLAKGPHTHTHTLPTPPSHPPTLRGRTAHALSRRWQQTLSSTH